MNLHTNFYSVCIFHVKTRKTRNHDGPYVVQSFVPSFRFDGSKYRRPQSLKPIVLDVDRAPWEGCDQGQNYLGTPAQTEQIHPQKANRLGERRGHRHKLNKYTQKANRLGECRQKPCLNEVLHPKPQTLENPPMAHFAFMEDRFDGPWCAARWRKPSFRSSTAGSWFWAALPQPTKTYFFVGSQKIPYQGLQQNAESWNIIVLMPLRESIRESQHCKTPLKEPNCNY